MLLSGIYLFNTVVMSLRLNQSAGIVINGKIGLLYLVLQLFKIIYVKSLNLLFFCKIVLIIILFMFVYVIHRIDNFR